MIHYHGGPITPGSVAYEVWGGRHAMVSFAHPQQIDIAASVCQSFTLDNGAFSAWRAGNPITDWSPFYTWAEQWLGHPACDWALIPDVIDGTEDENDALIHHWPLGKVAGVPVWHLHESIGRLERLSHEWPRIALGSSGAYADIGTPSWWKRIGQAMEAVCNFDDRARCKLHGLRMLDPAVYTRIPFASADSTNVARNIGLDGRWRGPYLPKSKELRGRILVERIEAHQAPHTWSPHKQGDWLDAFSDAPEIAV